MKSYFFKCFIISIAICFQVAMDVNADFFISFSGGITNTRNKLPNITIYKKLNEFHEILGEKWDDSIRLQPDVDYTQSTKPYQITISGSNFDISGFGTATDQRAGSFLNKLDKYLNYLRAKLIKIFPESEGFSIDEVSNSIIGYGSFDLHGNKGIVNAIHIKPLYLMNKYFPSFKGRIIEETKNIDYHYFIGAGRPIEHAITTAISPVESDIIQSWASATNPVTTKKNGLTLGLSGAYSKELFPKASSTFGLYTGVEGFAEINPNESKSNGFSIKEKSFGVRPFVGIAKKNNWTIYALGGVKCAKRDIKSDMFHVKKGKLSYEMGVGSDYILSDRFSISAKFIKCLTSKFNINGLSFQTSSTKILFSLNYHFK